MPAFSSFILCACFLISNVILSIFSSVVHLHILIMNLCQTFYRSILIHSELMFWLFIFLANFLNINFPHRRECECWLCELMLPSLCIPNLPPPSILHTFICKYSEWLLYTSFHWRAGDIRCARHTKMELLVLREDTDNKYNTGKNRVAG